MPLLHLVLAMRAREILEAPWCANEDANTNWLEPCLLEINVPKCKDLLESMRMFTTSCPGSNQLLAYDIILSRAKLKAVKGPFMRSPCLFVTKLIK